MWGIAVPLAHGALPWAISWLAPRYGWMEGRPGPWNLLGLAPVVAGAAGLIWVIAVGFAHARELPERVGLDWSPKLLLQSGPYAWTRNPMYVAELAIWLGWAFFFGSISVLAALVISCVVIGRVVRREERDLEAKFGDAYRRYSASVPRWVGKARG